jgi:hypothetical protein
LIEAIGVAAPVAVGAYSVREFAAESTVQVSPNVGAGAALATLEGPRSGDKQAAATRAAETIKEGRIVPT